MNELEKEILDIINPSAIQQYGYKFSSLKDTCANPNPPYTMRVTPLVYFFLNYHEIVNECLSKTIKSWGKIFTEKKMDYLIQNSPLHYLYPSNHINGNNDNGYFNPLLIAIEKFHVYKLTDNQYNFLIKNSDLEVNKNEGYPALILALYTSMTHHDFKLSNENWNLLKYSARSFDQQYIDKLVKKYNDPTDEYKILFPYMEEMLRQIIREQHIIASKEILEKNLNTKTIKTKQKKL